MSPRLVTNKLLAGVMLLLIASSSHAQSALEGFFPQDGAETPFSDDIELTNQRDIVLLRPKQEEAVPKKEEKKPEEKLAPEPEKPKDRRLNQPKTPEAIKEAYGDPSAPYPVAATEDAPGPFKAMYAAMNAGDDELAFKYAVQYVKFRQQLRSQNTKALSLMGHAQRKAGLLPAGSWPESGAHAEYAYLQDLEVEGIDDAAEKSIEQQAIDVTNETRALIDRLKETRHDLFTDKKEEIKSDLQKWEDKERAATRQKYTGKVPISKTGKVDVLVFLQSTQDESRELAPEIEKLYRKVKGSGNTNLAAFFTGPSTNSKMISFKSATGATFPILPGSQLFKKLGLKVTPAVVFVTPDGESHLEAGMQNFYKLDEIRKIMQGEKR